MGSAHLEKGNENIIKIQTNLLKENKPLYKPILIYIDTEDPHYYFSFLSQIDMEFCKVHSIGPRFLENVPTLFDKKYFEQERKILKELYSITNYKNYLKKHKKSIDYSSFFKSKAPLNITQINNLNECILFCPSSVFRIPLYCYKFYLEKPTKPSYSNFHVVKNNEQNIKQIELDLFRTSTKYNVMKEKNFINNFRALLNEISMRDEELAYVQGMNFIGAFILMLTGNQLELSLIFFFKILNMKSEYFNICFRTCYCQNFKLLINYLTLFKDLCFRYEKEIYDKLQEIEDNGFFWIGKWIQTLFVLNFKFEIAMKFWDIILSNGIDKVIDISLSIITFYKEEIIKVKCLEDFIEIMQRLNYLNENESKNLFSYILNNIENHNYKY